MYKYIYFLPTVAVATTATTTTTTTTVMVTISQKHKHFARNYNTPEERTPYAQLHSRVADVASAATASCELLFFSLSVDVYVVVCAAEKWANERDENEKDGVCERVRYQMQFTGSSFCLVEAQRYIFFTQTIWAANRMNIPYLVISHCECIPQVKSVMFSHRYKNEQKKSIEWFCCFYFHWNDVVANFMLFCLCAWPVPFIVSTEKIIIKGTQMIQ